jgi:hypothetical protein
VTYYKVLSDGLTSRNGGTYQWVLGEWAPEIEGELVPCHNGYHVCQESDLLEWLGPVICECEIGPESVRARDKTVARAARITRVLDTWNDRTARLFACDCAERVLPLFELAHPDDSRPRVAIETARRFANGEATSDELAAAGAAAEPAGAASWAAAGAASCATGDAVRAAAVSAGAASWAAARAARDAAVSARDAARAAERQWQARRLIEYLKGEAL